jgi:Zn-dependent protease
MPTEALPNPHAGSMRLLRVGGINVYVHWTWLLVAYFELRHRTNMYQSPVWNVIEYLTLFGIVLLHEFGHVLACRSVGGQASDIILWPLGGVAFVNPPPRPGAVLWSIAAGPLVNVVLVPVTFAAWYLSGEAGLPETNPDLDRWLGQIMMINVALLIFNLLPVYPLDGGQIVQALLWFVIGQPASLLVVSVIGMVAGGAAIAAAVAFADWWLVVLAAFVLFRSGVGFVQARLLARMVEAPVRSDAVCPACRQGAPVGEFWHCPGCRRVFDMFGENAICPGCGGEFATTYCPRCHQVNSIAAWQTASPAGYADEWGG